MTGMYKLAAIVGPTAVGKTNISIKVALKLNGEIISCDSMQIYRGMDIGTAKASMADRTLVPHHLIDFLDIDQEFSVADYQREARKLVADLNARGKLPIMVGGTGLYYQSVVDNYKFFPLQSHKPVREKWNQRIAEQGLEWAYQYLQKVDPGYAGIISSNDQKRIVRALEVYELTGQPFSLQQEKDHKDYKVAAVGLCMDREQLYDRINLRVEQMITDGLIDEVKMLMEKGYDLSHNPLQALGYKQVYGYLKGFLTWEGMVGEIKRETRRYAKRQLTWFKKDPNIWWVDATQYSESEMVEKISDYIEGQFGGM
ncbi:MAG: tRNA (adenosine(37)-N6)-dimethylallyltransferase MiaA [Syntrophomonadaceae bacterium]|jgi:tRNA dimethylallyltransferase